MLPVFASQSIENHGNSELMMAAYDGDLDKMRQLLKQGADINQTNKLGSTALYFAAGATRTQAAFKGSAEAVKFLLQHGATVNHHSNINGYTTLMAACSNQYAGSVALLLKYGEDVNALTKDGRSALFIAAESLQPEIVKLLLDHGARINGYADANGQTPLLAAIAASPNLNDTYSNKTALQITAASSSSLKIVAMLLAHKADINTVDRNGQAALGYAVINNNPDLVRMLLEHNADPHITVSSMANSTLLIMAARNRNVEISEMLLKKGANVNSKDQAGKNAMYYAIARGPDELVELLRKASTPK